VVVGCVSLSDGGLDVEKRALDLTTVTSEQYDTMVDDGDSGRGNDGKFGK
jgi:hypothetical protein